MADTSNERSGSRWEPDPAQPTEKLGGPIEQPTEIIPGLGAEQPAPAAPDPMATKRRIPRAAAAVAVVAAATIAGGAVGMAVAGNRTQPTSEATTSDPGGGVLPGGGDGFAPGDQPGSGFDPDGDGDGPGHGFGHDGDGDGHGPWDH